MTQPAGGGPKGLELGRRSGIVGPDGLLGAGPGARAPEGRVKGHLSAGRVGAESHGRRMGDRSRRRQACAHLGSAGPHNSRYPGTPSRAQGRRLTSPCLALSDIWRGGQGTLVGDGLEGLFLLWLCLQQGRTPFWAWGLTWQMLVRGIWGRRENRGGFPFSKKWGQHGGDPKPYILRGFVSQPSLALRLNTRALPSLSSVRSRSGPGGGDRMGGQLSVSPRGNESGRGPQWGTSNGVRPRPRDTVQTKKSGLRAHGVGREG